MVDCYRGAAGGWTRVQFKAWRRRRRRRRALVILCAAALVLAGMKCSGGRLAASEPREGPSQSLDGDRLVPAPRLSFLTRWWLTVLRWGLPVGSVLERQGQGAETGWRGWLHWMVNLLGGFRLDEPSTIIRIAPRVVPVTVPAPPETLPAVPETGTAEPPSPLVEQFTREERRIAHEPLVIIYHTHARESFLPALGVHRYLRPDQAHSDDLSVTVVRVGEELAKHLEEQHRIPVLHVRTVHDAQGRLGAYQRALRTLEAVKERYPSARIWLDIHRDSQQGDDTTLVVGGQRYARVMAVVGTGGDLPHPDWEANLRFARTVLEALETRQPGITLGIYPKPHRYNQHISPAALLLEIGGVDNRLEDALATARLLAEVLADIIRRGDYPR